METGMECNMPQNTEIDLPRRGAGSAYGQKAGVLARACDLSKTAAAQMTFFSVQSALATTAIAIRSWLQPPSPCSA